MASRNGIKRAITSPRENTKVSDLDKGFNTKALTIAHKHPTPRDESLDWRCAGHEDPEVFHPTDVATLIEAQSLCLGCPMRQACLALGRDRGECGVWGGVLLEGGKPLAAPRPPGRPKVAPGQVPEQARPAQVTAQLAPAVSAA